MDTPQHAASTAVARKRTDTELMPPPPPAKRIVRPKTVLDEDAYADGLSKIIARDFFPGLVESETQNEYLNALDSKDPAWIASAGRRLRAVMTPGGRTPGGGRTERRASSGSSGSFRLATPAGETPRTPRGYAGDTPASVVSAASAAPSSAAADQPAAVRTNVSLGGFQARYTSEDNESFYRLLDRQNQKRAEAHAWLWNGNQLPSRRQLQQKAVGARLQAAGRALVDDGFARDRLAIADRGADQRPAAPDTWKHSAKSALMFPPDDGAAAGAMPAAAAAAASASTAAPKSIVYANTRLLTAQQKQQQHQHQQQARAVPPSPTLSAVRDAIAGKPRAADADSTAAGSVAGDGGGGGETPRVNGYSFVADEDEDEDDDDDCPDADSAALALGPVDAAPNPFQLQDKSRREGLHHRMVERIAQSKRTSARVGLTGRVPAAAAHTPLLHTPRSVRGGSGGGGSSSSGQLTPAGQRLWDKIGGGVMRRNDAVTAFNRQHGRGPANGGRGSRRARLRQLRER